MQRLEVSGSVRLIYGSLGVKRFITTYITAAPPICSGTSVLYLLQGENGAVLNSGSSVKLLVMRFFGL